MKAGGNKSGRSREHGPDKKEYTVGYANPPQHSRFQLGQSGNKKGRPKGSRNLKTEMIEELSIPVKIRIGDREVKVSKHRALLMVLSQKALRGDMRALEKLLTLELNIFGLEGLPPEPEVRLTSAERLALDMFVKRVHEATGATIHDDENVEEVKK